MKKLFVHENEIVAKKKKVEKGASLVEYALLVALIAIVCIAAVKVIGTRASTQFSRVASNLS